MLHTKRTWCVNTVSTAEELALKLTEQTWTLCKGFRVAGHEEYLFLNDATSEDGPGEFGVIKGGLESTHHVQIESITFSWCNYTESLDSIQATLRGEYDQVPFAREVSLRLQLPEEHGRCPSCI